MTSKLLTNSCLSERLEAAREKERRARRDRARLQRELAVHDKRRANQQKMILGYAVLRAAESCSQQDLTALRRLVHRFVTRHADLEALRGTPFAVEAADGGGQIAPTGRLEP